MSQVDPVLGHVIGDRYRIVRHIGKGGFGAVNEAEHVHLKRLFAIKILKRDLALDRSHVKRFENEARITAAFDHENYDTTLVSITITSKCIS